MGTEVYRLFLMTNINNINANNNIGVIIFNLKKVEISVKHKITPMSRFICLRHSTVVSFSSLTPPFVRYPEFSNGCYSTTRNQVTDAAPTGFEPVPHAVTGRYCSHSTMEPKFCSLYGNRTRDFAVKGRRLNPLSNRPF